MKYTVGPGIPIPDLPSIFETLAPYYFARRYSTISSCQWLLLIINLSKLSTRLGPLKFLVALDSIGGVRTQTAVRIGLLSDDGESRWLPNSKGLLALKGL
jgi:hypothetical protein